MDDLQVIQNMPEGTVMFYHKISELTGKTKKKEATISFVIHDEPAQSLMRSILYNEKQNESEYAAVCVIFKNADFDKTKAKLTKK